MSAPPVLSFRSESKGGVNVDLAQLIASRLLIQANSGGGKSWLIRYLLEQTYGQIQQFVIDWEGEFSTLRERFDYVLVGGSDGDVPADPKSARVLVRRLLELNSSAIIDVYELKLQQRRHYVRMFLEALMSVPKTLYRPLLTVIDEAPMYAPESGKSEALEAVVSLCTQGRKRGFCAVLCALRLSQLNKDASASLLNRIIGRTGEDLDVKRAGDNMGFDKERRATLPQLDPGTFYAFGPAISKEVVLVRSGKVQTTHPRPGQVAPPTPPPPAAVKKVLAQMQGLQREAEEEARSIEDLQRQLATEKSKVRKLERGVVKPLQSETVVDQKAIARAVTTAERELRAQFDQAQRDQRGVDRQLRTQITTLGKQLGRVGGLAGQIVQLCGVDLEEVAAATPAKPNGSAPVTRAAPEKRQRPTPAPRSAAPAASGSTLPVGEHAVLTAACQYPDGVTREQITILTGYKRSTRDAYIVRLRAKELVDVVGNLIVAAVGAEDHLGDFEPLPTGTALQQYWLDKLPAGEAAVFQVLLEEHPDVVSRDQISDRTGYKRSTRDAYIVRLKARQVSKVSSDGVKAADFLFDEGV